MRWRIGKNEAEDGWEEADLEVTEGESTQKFRIPQSELRVPHISIQTINGKERIVEREKDSAISGKPKDTNCETNITTLAVGGATDV